ncbi:MarR family transcriptional regulator [Herbihabitans rhizosphaerae]|uniref:MarR family transcriptional regulator n=1 Tax=Herbihabitans rhizosphaerae TaxID=1872711 RepID=A0A4Q7KY00_9PSEU|nr:MarR family transcriptional regulator [Herbihabitans rhizosphaerae]RZS41230.1 MarR family transcriptional regulator [Herbihabitans rhizosphaerae]
MNSGTTVKTDEPSKADLATANAIGQSMVRLKRQMACAAAQLSKQGFEQASFGLLATLVNGGPQRSSSLAEALFTDPSTISRQVAHLVKEGLVERQADPADGRASVLAATQQGLAFFERHRRQRDVAIAQIVASWPAEDRTRFAELFERFADDYERMLPDILAERVAQARSEGEN